jgi:hypothetical protein
MGKDNFNAACAEKKVLEVLSYSLLGTASQAKMWRASFPSDDGSKCTCYDYFGAE